MDEDIQAKIENTKKEYDAYIKVSDGLLTLSNLPQTNTFKSRDYATESRKFANFAEECGKCLLKLYEIKKNRNI